MLCLPPVALPSGGRINLLMRVLVNSRNPGYLWDQWKIQCIWFLLSLLLYLHIQTVLIIIHFGRCILYKTLTFLWKSEYETIFLFCFLTVEHLSPGAHSPDICCQITAALSYCEELKTQSSLLWFSGSSLRPHTQLRRPPQQPQGKPR